jgi:predicted outer membrane repeat protein
MWFSSASAFCRSGSRRTRRPQPSPARQQGFRPHLETLEDRCTPSTLNVTSNADNGASHTLRWAVARARTGDTIDILTTQPIVLTQGELYLNKNLTIEAPAGSPATISGNHISRAFEIATGAVTMDDLIITGGNGMSVNPPNSGGWDSYGGGILNEAQLTVNNCTLSGNSASSGGGIANVSSGSLTVDNSILSGNSATYFGGGIANYGSLTVTTSSLSGDFAGYGGGGISNHGGATVSSSILSNNSATYGGGIENHSIVGRSAFLTVSASTVSGNSATYGGGIYTQGFIRANLVNSFRWPALVTISNSTLSGNSATSGGAIFSHFLSTVHVGGSTFFGNAPDNIFGTYIDDGGNSGL